MCVSAAAERTTTTPTPKISNTNTTPALPALRVEFGTLVISRNCGDLLYRLFRSDFVVCFARTSSFVSLLLKINTHTRER